MTKLLKILLLLLLISLKTSAQSDTIQYEVNLIGISSSGTYSPFWLQNNRYGKIASNPNSADLLIGFHKDFGNKKKLFDYSFKANLLVQSSSKTETYFQELYAKARFSVIDLIVGAREEHLGNQDSTLSCGGFLFSHNARPMPKIKAGIENFTAIPFTRGYLEVKGALSHGVFTDNIYMTKAYLHHKYIYGRIGGKLPIHFQYGLDHVAQWGGTHPTLGKQPSGLKNFITIFKGKSGGSDANISDQINTLGNHIISQSMKVELDLSNYKISGYWQNISEDGPIRFLWNSMNRPDGLWGVSIRNNKFPFIKGILYEYLNTTDQSGPYHDKDGIVYGGSDGYFNNGIYQAGWSYFSRTIGTPFISSPSYNPKGGICTRNSRVQVHHWGIEGDIYGYQYRVLTSLSKNYGTYYDILEQEKLNNTSMAVDVNKKFRKLPTLDFGCSVAADFGKIYGNSVACLFSIRKTGDLFHY